MYHVEQNALVHYGVKGQKWGVRKYQNEDGTLTQLGKEHYGLGNNTGSYGNRAFERKYAKESKKYQKWLERSDIDLQREKAEEYRKKGLRAAKIGAAAAVAGASSQFIPEWDTVHNVLVKAGLKSKPEPRFFYTPDDLDIVKSAVGLGAAALSIGSTATAGAYAIKLAKTKKYTNIIGNQKAVARRDAQYKKLSNMVKDTPYMALFKDQIEAYKKEHPNSELSDKQIMKNLM